MGKTFMRDFDVCGSERTESSWTSGAADAAMLSVKAASGD